MDNSIYAKDPADRVDNIYTMDPATITEDEREERAAQIRGNASRAERGRQAVMAVHGPQKPGKVDLDTSIGDTLSDLMHLADVEGLDFEALLAQGKMHYDAEAGTDSVEWFGDFYAEPAAAGDGSPA